MTMHSIWAEWLAPVLDSDDYGQLQYFIADREKRGATVYPPEEKRLRVFERDVPLLINGETGSGKSSLVNRILNRQPETEDDLLPNMTVWTGNANPKAWYYLAVQEATNSHYYEFKTNSQYEKWTELRETRDWTQLEK